MEWFVENILGYKMPFWGSLSYQKLSQWYSQESRKVRYFSPSPSLINCHYFRLNRSIAKFNLKVQYELLQYHCNMKGAAICGSDKPLILNPAMLMRSFCLMNIYFSVENEKVALRLHPQLSSGPKGSRRSPVKPWPPQSSKVNQPAGTTAMALRQFVFLKRKE